MPTSDHRPGTWAESGAQDLLDEFLNEAGPADWLPNLQSRVLNGGSDTLNCSSLEDSCPIPLDGCPNAPGWFWIQVMAGRVHKASIAARDILDNETGSAALHINEMLVDFEIEVEEDETKDILTQAKSFVGIAGSILGAIPQAALVSTALGVIAGSLDVATSFMDDAEEPDDTDLQAALDTYLEDFADATSTAITQALKAIFGNGEDPERLDKLVATIQDAGFGGTRGDFNNTISNVLAGGNWLNGSSIQRTLMDSIAKIKSAILGRVLAGRGYVVVEWDRPTQGHCNFIRTGRWIDDKCYFLAARPDGGNSHQDISIEQRDTLNDHGMHEDDMEAFYRNVRACDNGEPEDGINLGEGGYPACYFALPFFIANAESPFPFGYNRSQGSYPGGDEAIERIPFAALQERASGDTRDDCMPRDRHPDEWDSLDTPSCFINTGEVENFFEGGAQRYRTEISSINLPDGQSNEDFCSYVDEGCFGGSNIRCYEEGEGEETRWLVDISFTIGPLGSTQNGDCIESKREDWEVATTCGTGAGEDGTWGAYDPWDPDRFPFGPA